MPQTAAWAAGIASVPTEGGGLVQGEEAQSKEAEDPVQAPVYHLLGLLCPWERSHPLWDPQALPLSEEEKASAPQTTQTSEVMKGV